MLGQRFLATWGPDTTESGVELAEELLEICARTGDQERELNTRSWLVSLLCELDDLPGARRHSDAYAELAERLRQPRMQMYVPLHEGMTAILEGRWEDAERSAMGAGELGGRTSNAMAPLLTTAQLGVARVEQDRGAEIEEAVRAFATRHAAMPAWRAALVLVLAQAGREAEASDELERLAARDFTDLPRDSLWLPAMWLLARATSELADAPRARRLYELLEPYADRNAVSPEAAGVGPMSLALDMLAATAGERETALAHLGTARRTALRIGARPTLARAALLEAELRAEDEPGRARPLAAEALARGEELGLEALTERAAAVLDGFDTPVVAAPRFARQGREAILRREGDVWAMGTDGELFRLRDAKGLVHLAQLLSRPGEELHALDLVAHAEGGMDPRAIAGSVAAELSIRAGGQADVGPTLDAEAKRSYRDRAIELRDELEEAESFNDPERAARAREELAWIAEQLTGAVGRGARPSHRVGRRARARERHSCDPRGAAAGRRARRGAGAPPAGDRAHRQRLLVRAGPDRAARLDGRPIRGALRRGRRRQRVRRIPYCCAARGGGAQRARARAGQGVPAGQLPADAVGDRARVLGSEREPARPLRRVVVPPARLDRELRPRRRVAHLRERHPAAPGVVVRRPGRRALADRPGGPRGALRGGRVRARRDAVPLGRPRPRSAASARRRTRRHGLAGGQPRRQLRGVARRRARGGAR